MKNELLTAGKYYHIYNRGNNRMNLFIEPRDYEHFLWLYNKYISPVAETMAWVLMPNHLHLLVKIKEHVVYKYSLETLERIAPDKIWFDDHKWETIDLSASAGPDNVGLEDMISAGPDNVSLEETSSAGPDNVSLEDMISAGPDNAGLEETLFAGPDNIGLEDMIFAGPDNVGLEDMISAGPDNLDLKIVNNIKKFNEVKFEDIERLKFKTPVPYRHFSHLFNAYTRYFHNRTGGCGNLFERPFKRKQVENEEYLKRVILYIHNNPVHHGFCTHPLEYPWSSYISCVSEKPTKLKRQAVKNLFENTDNFKMEHSKKIEIEPIEKWLNVDIDYLTGISNLPDLSAFAEPDNVKSD